MATIKSFTDLQQSKKLVEILPLESADMFCADVFDKEKETHSYNFHILSTWGCNTFEELKDRENKFVRFIPCWSATALLDLLPNIIKRGKEMRNWYWFNLNKEPYQISYGNRFGSSGEWHDMVSSPQRDDLVDACYDMIVYLIENKYINTNEL